MSRNRARDWLKQAENDMLWANDTLRAGHYAQACFVAQQVCEKALKALAYLRDYDLVKSHSLLEISRALNAPEDITDRARRLDLYYISTRYPDAFPSGAPYEFFTSDQAEDAVLLARGILDFAGSFFNER